MPKVSVVILNWNGLRYLKPCLYSLTKIQNITYEIIVVDNKSTDGSQEFIKKKYPKIHLIENPENKGFAEGNNIGWKAAKGEYILFLNNDTTVEPNFLQPLIDHFHEHPNAGCVQPQMRVSGDKNLLDAAGSYLTFTGFLYHYGYRKPYRLSQYQQARQVFSIKGACMLMPKRILNRIGGFDEDFFIYFEETDVCHRLWLSGYEVWYVPSSNIYHVAGGDTISTYKYDRRIYLTFKNMNCSYIKNFGSLSLLTIYPLFILFQVGLLLFFLLKLKISSSRALILGILWNVRNISLTLKKRAYIQHALRKIPDYLLSKRIMYNPSLYYYYCLLFDAKRYKDGYIL